MNRRHLLGLLGTCSAGVTGCLGAESADTPPQTDATEPPASTPTLADSRLELPASPDRPGSFTRSSALEFAVQFEKSYLARRAVQGRDEITSVEVRITEDIADKGATRTADRWVSRCGVIGPAYQTTGGHVDPSLFVAN